MDTGAGAALISAADAQPPQRLWVLQAPDAIVGARHICICGAPRKFLPASAPEYSI
jgi:hypothetical protein